MAEESRSRNNRFKQISSIVLAIALLGVVLASVSFSELVDAIKLLNINLLIAAYALNLIMAGLMAYRWHILYIICPENRPTYVKLLRVKYC